MDFGLTDDQRDIQRTARDLLGERATFARVRETIESHPPTGATDTALWKELCELGWPGIAVSEEHGGQGLGAIELSILCEELGRVVAPVPFLGSAMAACVIEQAGTPQQRERWLPGLASGETIGALAGASEGTAELVVSGAEAGVIVLVEDDGSGRIVTRADAEIAPVAAIDPTRSAARVSAPEGAGEALEAGCPGLGRALVAVSAELVGVAERALEMTVAYVKDRKQFGVPVGAYQAVSHRCAQMLLDTEQARSMTAFAAWSADANPDGLAEAAAMAKAAASTAGREVTAAAIQMHGGIGFTWEADVHWLFKRAQLDAALLGGAGRHRARVAAILADRVAASTAA
ncbi:MAG TPA: acyl-CoA dehydrogenase family protein [Solirubrobacteraceae bacterium]|jgi:alkylation response protein AidB-like acyl-CoA dehydrogenase|nr:acyl-CoA dehydrogenase family protein [Solirubrobacteraceae bacterium]